MDLDSVRQSSKAHVVLVLPVSIEDCPLLWMVVRSQTYYHEHILAYGSGKASYALIRARPTDWRRGKVEV